MYRILIFSDIHYSKNSLPQEKRWYPEIVFLLSILSDRLAQRFLDFCDHCTRRHFKTFEDAVAKQNFDAVFCLGDMTPGAQERGLISGKSRAEAVELKEKLIRMFGNQPHFVLGNHDTGYVAPIGYKKGGISMESFEIALKIYDGKPFYKLRFGDYKYVALTSALVGQKGKLEEIEQRQLEFLKKELSDNGKCFLLIHSPFAFFNRKMRQTINNAENIEAIIYGDTHHRLVGKIVGWFVPVSQRMIPVPSVIGFFGIGRGFLELIIDREYELRYSRL